MEFTVKQKIVAAVIAGLLVFGFFASTITAVFVSLDEDSKAQSEISKKEKQLKDRADNKSDDISDIANPEDIQPTIDAQMKHDNSVAVAKRSETTSTDIVTQGQPTQTNPQVNQRADQQCSANLRASLEGYRDGLVDLEHKRWAKVQKELSAKAIKQDSTDTSSSKELSYSELEVKHKTRLNEIEREFQQFLKQNKCS